MVKGQKYHILYKTTCIVTGNFYIGVHSTIDLEDGYMGSGLRLSRSVEKHGIENHFREILEFFETRESLMNREREIVNEELLEEEKCMNLKPGGEGGFCNEEHSIKCSIAGNKGYNRKLETDISFRNKMSKLLSETAIKTHKAGKVKYDTFKGKQHSEKSKIQIGLTNSIKQKGEKNSQYGTCWIMNSEISKKISKNDLEKYLNLGWKKGRIINNTSTMKQLDALNLV